MTREEIENEIRSIDAVLASRKTVAIIASPEEATALVTPAVEIPVKAAAVQAEIAHEESIFDDDGFSEIAEAAAPVGTAEAQIAARKAPRDKRKLFTLKNMALAAAAVACAWFFMGQGDNGKTGREVADHSTTTDAFAPRAVAQGPVPVPVQKPMSSVSVVSTPVEPTQPPVVKPVEVESPVKTAPAAKPVVAPKAPAVKPMVAAPKAPAEPEAPKAHVKRQAAVHHELPVVAKSAIQKPTVKVAAAQVPVKVEKMTLVQPADNDDISSLKQARELN